MGFILYTMAPAMKEYWQGGGGRNNSPGVSNVKSFLIDIPNG